MTYPIGEDHLRASIAVSVQCHCHHAAQCGLKRDVAGRSSLGRANFTHHTGGQANTHWPFSMLNAVRVSAVSWVSGGVLTWWRRSSAPPGGHNSRWPL